MSKRPSSLIDTRVIYCGDNLEQLAKLPDGCIDLIYIDPPFNSNRNYEVFWGETKEKRSFGPVGASAAAEVPKYRTSREAIEQSEPLLATTHLPYWGHSQVVVSQGTE